MTPYEQAVLVYACEPCARSFEDDLRLHMMYGYVVSTPDVFLMGRPVEKNADETLIKDPAYKFYNPDTWLVYLAAGDMAKFFDYEPYPLPWMAWERQNVLRFHRREHVYRLLAGSRPDCQSLSNASTVWLRPASQGRETETTETASTACAYRRCRQPRQAPAV